MCGRYLFTQQLLNGGVSAINEEHNKNNNSVKCSGGVRGGSGEINHTSVFEYPHHPLPLFYALTHTLSCLLYSTLPATLALLLSLTLTYIRRFQHKHQQREAKRATLCKAITTTTTDHIKMRPKKIVTVSYDSSSHSNSKKRVNWNYTKNAIHHKQTFKCRHIWHAHTHTHTQMSLCVWCECIPCNTL